MATASPQVIEVRHHPVLLLARAWQPGVLLVSTAIATVVIATAPQAATWPLYAPLLRLLLIAFVVAGCWAGWIYLWWSSETLYLTERRLIEIVGVRHFSQERREIRIERIQSVEIEQRNPLMRQCGCGDVIVSIAGVGPLRFAAAREVVIVRDLILARLWDRDHAQVRVEEAAVRASVADLLDRSGDREATPPLLTEQETVASATPSRRPPRPRRSWRRRSRIAGTVWHRHAWFLVRSAVRPAALVVTAFALPVLLGRLVPGATLPHAGGLIAGLLLIASGWLAWLWADWRNDHYVVTPRRLIEIEQLPLGLRQQVNTAALDRVQDIRYRLPTPLAHLLNYGDVTVYTASDAAPFVFRGVARPRQLADQIDHYVTAFILAEEEARHQALRAEFAQWLDTYQQLRPGEA